MESRDRLIATLAAAELLASAAPAAARAPLVVPTRGDGAAATWIVTARATPRTSALARRFGASPVGRSERLVVARARAGELVAALRRDGLLRWAEPNRTLQRPAQPVPASTAMAFRARLGLAGLTLPAPAAGPSSRSSTRPSI